MQTESNLLDYGSLSSIREYRPLIGVNPADVDPLYGEARTCQYCSSPLYDVDDLETAWGDPAAILTCSRCGWWCQYAVGFNRDGFYEWERVPAALRTYAIDDIDAPLNALRWEIAKNPYMLDGLNPTKMEMLVGSILHDVMDCEVIHTGRTGDGGIDLLLLQSNTQYVVQVKHRESKRRGESVSAIREFLGATLLAGSRRGVYVTTATHFTSAAADAASLAKSLGLIEKLHLIDRDRFLRLLKMVSDRTVAPWRAFYRDVEGVDFDDPIYVRFHGEHSRCEWSHYDEAGNLVFELRPLMDKDHET